MAVAVRPTTPGASRLPGRVSPGPVVVAVALVVLAAALLVADVRLAASETRSEAQVASAAAGAADAGDAAGARLVLHVEGSDGLAEALRRGLAATLGAPGLFAGVEVRSAPPAAADHPALVAGVAGRDVFWTPLYAAGTVEVGFAYASDRGDLSWREAGVFAFGGGAAVQLQGRVRVTDTTRGLVSRPAYVEHLGRAAAARVAEQLRSVLARPPAGSVSRYRFAGFVRAGRFSGLGPFAGERPSIRHASSTRAGPSAITWPGELGSSSAPSASVATASGPYMRTASATSRSASSSVA
jgi:hypothetical protein